MAALASPTPRVVVADDSRLMRRILADALGRQGFDVVATAADGDEALAACDSFHPDALTLDLHMPGLDGLGVLRVLRERRRSPIGVVVVSAFSPAHGARAVDALAEGAFDLVAKPAAADSVADFTAELARKVSDAAAVGRTGRARFQRAAAPAPSAAPAGTRRFVVIACSTGGPRALAELVPQLPTPLGHGSLIVQHMPAGFTASLAERLDATSALTVREAAGDEAMDAGHVYLAPGGAHLRMGGDRRVRLSDEAPLGGLRPRADLTIADAAEQYRSALLLVVLTGMGKDGLEGARAVKRAGGRVLVEDASTCAVYGMPRAIAEAGLADGAFPLHELPAAIAREAGA